MHKMVVCTNPRSGSNLRNKFRVRGIKDAVKPYTVYATESLDELDKVALEIAQIMPEIVVIDGGDGTVSTVISAIDRHWAKDRPFPHIALLLGGTFNALAKYAGISNSNSYLRHITRSPQEELFFQDIDLMEIEDNNGLKSYGFSFGTGLPLLLLEEFYRNKTKDFKYLRIAWMAMRLVTSSIIQGKYFQSFNHHLNLEVGENRDAWLALMCQTIPSFGAYGCNMLYRAGLAHKQFHALGTNSSLVEFRNYFYSIYRGKQVPITQVDYQTDSLRITSEKEFKYQVNGELEYWGKKCIANEVTIKHGLTIKVIKPSPNFWSR